VSLLHTHLVLVTTCRRPVFTDEMLTFRTPTMGTGCVELDADLVEFHGETDDEHLLVHDPPTLAIPALEQRLKGPTAHPVRREHTGRCVRPHARTRLVPVLLRRLLPMRTTDYHQSNTSTAKHDHSRRRARPGDTRDGLTES
jgi:putative transposase